MIFAQVGICLLIEVMRMLRSTAMDFVVDVIENVQFYEMFVVYMVGVLAGNCRKRLRNWVECLSVSVGFPVVTMCFVSIWEIRDRG